MLRYETAEVEYDAARTRTGRDLQAPYRKHLLQPKVAGDCVLPWQAVQDRVQRYEAHLQRQFDRALHELQAQQHARRERETAEPSLPAATRQGMERPNVDADPPGEIRADVVSPCEEEAPSITPPVATTPSVSPCEGGEVKRGSEPPFVSRCESEAPSMMQPMATSPSLSPCEEEASPMDEPIAAQSDSPCETEPTAASEGEEGPLPSAHAMREAAAAILATGGTPASLSAGFRGLSDKLRPPAEVVWTPPEVVWITTEPARTDPVYGPEEAGAAPQPVGPERTDGASPAESTSAQAEQPGGPEKSSPVKDQIAPKYYWPHSQNPHPA